MNGPILLGLVLVALAVSVQLVPLESRTIRRWSPATHEFLKQYDLLYALPTAGSEDPASMTYGLTPSAGSEDPASIPYSAHYVEAHNNYLQMPGNAAFFTVLCAIAVRKASVKGQRGESARRMAA